MTDVQEYIATIEAHGSPAFPAQYKLPSGGEYQSPGMTLRDWFAGQALPALIEAGVRGDLKKTERETNAELISRLSFEMADAMLAERSK